MAAADHLQLSTHSHSTLSGKRSFSYREESAVRVAGEGELR
jgi:hypothetical protein